MNLNSNALLEKKALQLIKMKETKKHQKEYLRLKISTLEDRIDLPVTSLKCVVIKDNMGWCDDIKFPKKYNKLIKINKKFKHEKLKRKDHKYDLLIPIKYNFKKPVAGLGSCIFIHLTKDYNPTAGCIALKKKDFLIMLKLIKKNSKIKII